MKILEPIWSAKPETASRVRGRIENILDWATVLKYREGDNPARWRGNLNKLLPPTSKVRRTKHHEALPYEQLPDFMHDLWAREGTSALALEFLILTAARTSEVINATWAEIDSDNNYWTIAADRMKSNRQHRVPLCERTVEILRSLPREDGNEHVFIGPSAGKGLSNMAMSKLLRRMGRDNITVHGFRSTFRDWAAERTAYPNEVAEMALAHVISDKTEEAYRRGDLFEKRRRLMDDWAKYAETEPHDTGAVVAIRGQADD